jgi:hypothetical protein
MYYVVVTRLSLQFELPSRKGTELSSEKNQDGYQNPVSPTSSSAVALSAKVSTVNLQSSDPANPMLSPVS